MCFQVLRAKNTKRCILEPFGAKWSLEWRTYEWSKGNGRNWREKEARIEWRDEEMNSWQMKFRIGNQVSNCGSFHLWRFPSLARNFPNPNSPMFQPQRGVQNMLGQLITCSRSPNTCLGCSRTQSSNLPFLLHQICQGNHIPFPFSTLDEFPSLFPFNSDSSFLFSFIFWPLILVNQIS